jgi:hypothetical protein
MAPCFRRSPWPLVVGAALALALVPAGDAAARKFQMSGTWVARGSSVFPVVFLPLQFVGATGSMSTMQQPIVHASLGNLTHAFGFPNGPIPGQGGVTATGSGPATLRIPPHRFVEDAMAGVPLNGVSLAQITTRVGTLPTRPRRSRRAEAPGASPGARATRRAWPWLLRRSGRRTRRGKAA